MKDKIFSFFLLSKDKRESFNLNQDKMRGANMNITYNWLVYKLNDSFVLRRWMRE